MARVKRGTTSHAKHKKLHEMNKGYRMPRHRLIRVAKEAALHAGEYAFHGRKLKKRDMRRLWITRISGQLSEIGLNYSRFINGLKKANILIDRKMIANLAVDEPVVFKALVEKVKETV